MALFYSGSGRAGAPDSAIWFALAPLACLLVTCGSTSEDPSPADSADAAGAQGCPAGTERCPCYGNGTCNEELVCASGLCVALPDSGGAGSSGRGGASSGGSAGAGGTGPIGGAAPVGGSAGSAAAAAQGGAGAVTAAGAAGTAGFWLVAPGCVVGLGCGDAVVQLEHEQCDDGVNAGGYGQCAPGCVLGPHCGDGLVQPPWEACDDGDHDANDGCSPWCQLQ